LSPFTARITSPTLSYGARRRSPCGDADRPILSSIRVENTPSQGRAGLLKRPNLKRSSSTGSEQVDRHDHVKVFAPAPARSRSICSEPMPNQVPGSRSGRCRTNLKDARER